MTDYDTLLRLGEAPSLFEPVSDGESLVVCDGYVLFFGRTDHPAYNTVQHLRLSPERVDAALAETRALVAARWEDAVTRGTPALVTRSGPMSRPILERAGFVELAEIAFLLDTFD